MDERLKIWAFLSGGADFVVITWGEPSFESPPCHTCPSPVWVHPTETTEKLRQVTAVLQKRQHFFQRLALTQARREHKNARTSLLPKSPSLTICSSSWHRLWEWGKGIFPQSTPGQYISTYLFCRKINGLRPIGWKTYSSAL